MVLLWVILIPLAGGVFLGALGHRRWAFFANIAFSAATALAACVMTADVLRAGPLLALRQQFFIDPLNVFLVDLTALVGLTTSIFSRSYMRVEDRLGHLTQARLRAYHAMYQLFLFTMLLALTTNNIGVLWVAMEGATLSTALLVSLYRTPQGLAAAWKSIILCGVGIALALLGTILVYFAAHAVLGAGGALLWTRLEAVKARLDPAVMAVAFVFLVVGYGTKVGLVPLHNWLPDAHAEGPAPISALLSGLLLNVALYAIVRFKALASGTPDAHWPAALMMGFGLVSVLVATFSLGRQRDVKRLFAYSSIEHMGLATFAFGMGGPLANFAALLHMTVHSLTKSSIFFTSGHVAQKAGTRDTQRIAGVMDSSPAAGWAFLLGGLAILGMPPFGVFASEFLILTAAVHDAPWSVPLLILALGVAFATIFQATQGMVFGASPGPRGSRDLALAPSFVHLALVLALGLYIPHALAAWYAAAARLAGR